MSTTPKTQGLPSKVTAFQVLKIGAWERMKFPFAVTLPETDSSLLKNGWLEDDSFPFGARAPLSGVNTVSFREAKGPKLVFLGLMAQKKVSWMHGCGEPSFGHSSKSRGARGST